MTDPEIAAGGLLASYAAKHPEAFADAVARAGQADAGHLVARLPDESQPAVIARLPQAIASPILEDRPDETILRWLTLASPNDATLIGRRLDAGRRETLLSRLPASRRRVLERAVHVREGTVGALADGHYDWLRHDATVADAARVLRSRPAPGAPPLLVLDDADRLVGVFDAERGLAHGLDALVRDCVAPVRPLPASTALRAAVKAFADRGVGWLPVVDNARRPIGILEHAKLGRTAFDPAERADDALTDVAGIMFEVMSDLPRLMLGGSHRA